ncbi:Ig-like domain-containing protein [Bacillus solimangrovi]|uniref:SbsA Ig-like domain-containing protein n=1 Tax=Bacillus solimangrovi TaxID=1305675 RepID=A0A1E5LDL1_9BACI|nr:Ig-like domain-containing protein [Bacillus solimangrovi]OEH92164.1 hypothetical protein BFG57_02525 [Bacillus solimangrovi]
MMRFKSNIFLLTFFLIACLSFISPLHAADYLEWEHNVTEDAKKAWTVSFNDKVKRSSVSRSTVFITNSKSIQVKSTVQLSKDQKSFTVTPLAAYQAGETYQLTITNKVKSVDNVTLTKTVIMPFKYVEPINEEEPTILPTPETQVKDEPLSENVFKVEVELGAYISQVKVTANDYISSVKIEGNDMHYLGNNEYQLGLSGLESGQYLNIQGFDNNGKLIQRERHTIE